MNRREIREQIFKMLFQTEFYEKEEIEEQMRIFMEELSEKTKGNVPILKKRYTRSMRARMRSTQ